MRRRKWIIVLAVLVVFASWLAVRETRDRINKQRASPVIRDLGGRIGSLTPPVPFSGSEIRIEFHDTEFKKDELKRLSVLEPLASKHWVGVMFEDTNLSESDVVELRAMLPNCHLIRVVNGELQDDR